ncbi:hypothetical protein PoB_000629400 [Plakobranchus ocellatus]|uniref:Uncharacterized protein n=1 Tax=Plakobranchus ocellatus TaxID=259542 RepID=A0AAV3YC03_9GAST|nr:hypothetical protein PoB_000629400 [Plakobranchus ocellatus]
MIEYNFQRKREPTLEAAVHVSTIHVWKHSSVIGTRAHQVGCDFHLVEASELTFVSYSLALTATSATSILHVSHYKPRRFQHRLCWIQRSVNIIYYKQEREAVYMSYHLLH